jgi:hypothetical protein
MRLYFQRTDSNLNIKSTFLQRNDTTLGVTRARGDTGHSCREWVSFLHLAQAGVKRDLVISLSYNEPTAVEGGRLRAILVAELADHCTQAFIDVKHCDWRQKCARLVTEIHDSASLQYAPHCGFSRESASSSDTAGSRQDIH